jgi:hypothetical protein
MSIAFIALALGLFALSIICVLVVAVAVLLASSERAKWWVSTKIENWLQRPSKY